MAGGDRTAGTPPIEEFQPVFRTDYVTEEDDRWIYVGERLARPDVLMRQVEPALEMHGYEAVLSRRDGDDVIVATPTEESGGVPWINIVLFLATVVSTLFAGTIWYQISDPFSPPTRLLGAWPFAAAVMGVLGVHELGHYVMSRHHDIDASLPYFIPLPITFIGTAGAVIRIRDRMPTRTALFDVGVAGPLAGLAATIVVTVIGLSLPPIPVRAPPPGASGPVLLFNDPPLLQLIATAIGEPTGYPDDPTKRVSPVVFGGWVGMFITFLNLLPVGQLDGGHILRSLIGKRQALVSVTVPGLLFAMAGYLYFVENLGVAVSVWIFWGVLTALVARAGAADPMIERELDPRRKAVAVLTAGLGLLCFTPVPVQIIA